MDVEKSFPEAASSLGYLLRSPYRKLSKRLYDQLEARGFSQVRPSHAAVLRHISPGGSRVSELAEQAELTKQSMAYLVDGLQQAGYLSLRPDPADGRAKLARLTKRGEALLATLLQISGEIEASAVVQLGAARHKRLREDLRRLDVALDGAY